MIGFILTFVLAAFAALTMTMRKTYDLVPDFELRRQAQAGDELALVLYRAVAYGSAAQLLLWLLTLLATAGSIGIIATLVPGIVLFFYALALSAYVLVWLPRVEVTNFGVRCVVWSTPGFMWLLSHLFTFLEKPARAATQHQMDSQHTGLYEREDVVKLLERQKQQADNRLTETEIEQLLQAITYSRKKVSQIMKGRKKVRTVLLNEAIGPILMDELHASGNSFFPVCEQADSEHIVGVLYMSDLLHIKNGGYVRDVMRADVFYVNEDFSIEQLLHAFLQTKQQVLVVINIFEEWVGLVTIGNALRHIVGHKIESSFNNYDSRAAVAAFKEQLLDSKALQANLATQKPEHTPASAPTAKPAEKSKDTTSPTHNAKPTPTVAHHGRHHASEKQRHQPKPSASAKTK